MIFRIRNILSQDGHRWRYRGVVTHKTKRYKVTGTIARLFTQGMIKKAVIEDARKQVLELVRAKRKTTKLLTEDENFVDVS